MEEDKIATIYVATEEKILHIAYTSGCTAEELCIKVCQHFKIGPVARHLFAMRNRSTKYWYHAGFKFDGKEKHKLDFRLRFKPSSLHRLKQIDLEAYEYYFEQVRGDLLENKVPDIVYERHKRELVGLGVCDMYRVMVEKDIAQEIVESDYKKYIPKECIKRHLFFIKKPIHNALSQISGHDASFVKEQYLDQFETIAPNYLCDEFKAIIDKGQPNSTIRVLLRINATDIQYCHMDENNNNWKILCAIEDLCFVSIKQDNTVEISRKNGIPSFIQFNSNSLLMSFVSVLDGYYRLSTKWTFNLCGEAVTPSLETLHKLKCHGPVGGKFSYLKLDEKRANRPGTFILRESELKYDSFYIDFCGKDSKPRTKRIDKLGPEDYVLSDTMERFKSFAQLVAAHKDPESSLYLNECLPPSEYDKSPLLLCAPEGFGSVVAVDEEIVSEILERKPQCILPNNLQVYKAQPFPKSKESQMCSSSSSCEVPATTLYRAMWRITKGKRLETVIRLSREEEGQSLREFLKLTQKWEKLQSSAIVRLYGTTLAPPIGMVLEFVKLGPLSAYLRNNTSTIKTVDLLEAAQCLVSAVLHMEENGVVHGNIRCRKLLVHEHTENGFVVKLADPGVFNYKPSDVHWLPPECYGNPDLAKRSNQADIWAVGTTLWEIFSRGALLPANNDPDAIKKFYASGKRLSTPSGCPPEVYKLMIDCWDETGDSRIRPNSLMRDIHTIKIQRFYSRRNHAQAIAFPKLSADLELTSDDLSELVEHNSSSDCESRASSLCTERTSLPWDDSEDNSYGFNPADWGGISPFNVTDDLLSSYIGNWWAKMNGSCNDPGDTSYENDGDFCGCLQSRFKLDEDRDVILQGRIGRGFYGEVYLGTLDRDDRKIAEFQEVAVKKLKIQALQTDLRDVEQEVNNMKTLKHPNIVEIFGTASEPEVCLIMEFVKHGSLRSYLAIHRESLTTKRLLGYALDIATGMAYLSRKNIVHRDLAARNVLVAEDSKVKITDFALAQIIGENDFYILQANRDHPIKWYAPESLRDGKFSTHSDVWSFGVTMYETFSFGEDPKLPELIVNGMSEVKESEKSADSLKLEDSAELLKALESGMRLPCPPTCPQQVYIKVMAPCWHIHSHQRPDFTNLCSEIKDLIDNL